MTDLNPVPGHGPALPSESLKEWLKAWRQRNKGKPLDIADIKHDALDDALMHYWCYQDSLKAAYELEFSNAIQEIGGEHE